MAFKPVAANTVRRPFITVTFRSERGEMGLTLNTVAARSLGEPTAISFEWDDEDSLLRISAALPDDPEASRLPRKSGNGVAVTTMFRELGVEVAESRRFTVTPDGPTAVIADLSECVAA